MNRPNLILRRHGPMTFGLGYFQDGVWVDHLAADDHGARERAADTPGEHDVNPIDVVHQWFSCCADPVERVNLVQDRDGTVVAVAVPLGAVAGTAQR
jgi:hypothetical protein